MLDTSEVTKIAHKIILAYQVKWGDTEYFGIFSEDKSLNPKENHVIWTAKMMSNGWRHGYRYTCTEHCRSHPAITSFDKLPIRQQMVDIIFWEVVHALKPHTIPDENILGVVARRTWIYECPNCSKQSSLSTTLKTMKSPFIRKCSRCSTYYCVHLKGCTCIICKGGS